MRHRLLPLIAAAMLALPGAPAPAAAAAAAAPKPPLNVAVVWHQHQPQYPKRPGTNVYEQPWVRVHGTKDYLDMAAMVEEFPGLKLTVNLTPVLLRQIEDYMLGASDRHMQLATKNASQLTADEKAEAHRRFFQVSGPMLKQFPRFVELKAKPPASYTAQDHLDLQVLFNLAWTDRMFWSDPVVAPLVKKGRRFTEPEKLKLLGLHRAIMGRIIPLHKRLQEAGRIEVTTTPYYHPILPLIHDTALAREAMPHAAMPEGRMQRPDDAKFHVEEAVKYYKRLFGRPPAGMWPGEGSVAQAVAPLFKAAGIRWIATDEEVLARSLSTPLRDGETLVRPDVLYQPYQVTNGPAIIFRDRKLSDDIGFRYSKMSGEAAAADLLGQLRVAAKRPGAPKLVSIILDGENAWENYPDDGKAFLRALYKGLTTDPAFKTVTPAEYLATHTPRPLPRLWAGSWIGASYATWIGEDEENAAWDMLIRAREAVAAFGRQKGKQHGAYRRAMDKIYAAEGSDWFWWYGQDQDSGRDEEFDTAFRALLTSSYREIGLKPPTWLAVPIIQAGAKPTRLPSAYMRPTLDGVLARAEWAQAGSVFAQGGAMNIGNQPVGALFYGYDKQNLYLAIQYNGETRPVSLAIGLAGKPGGTQSPEAGFNVHYEANVVPSGDRARLRETGAKQDVPDGITAKGARGAAEIAIPWSALGARSGDGVLLRMEVGASRFPDAPLRVTVPTLPVKSLVTLPDGRDGGIGPGAYTLPTGGAYTPASVDLQSLSVGEERDRWAFTWQLGEVRNPWSSPIGLSLVALDLYLAPLAGAGAPMPLLDGRGALAARPWSHALWIEGWQQGLYGPDGNKLADVEVVVDAVANEVRAYVPKSALTGDPTSWAYLGVLAGQDGFAPGRIRAVQTKADAERFGGRARRDQAPLLDVLLPAGAHQGRALTPVGGRVVLPYVTPRGRLEGAE